MLSETFSQTRKLTSTIKSASLSCTQSSPVRSSLGSTKCFTGCTFISITVPFGPLCHLFFFLATNLLCLPSTSIQMSTFDRRLLGVLFQSVPIMRSGVGSELAGSYISLNVSFCYGNRRKGPMIKHEPVCPCLNVPAHLILQLCLCNIKGILLDMFLPPNSLSE